MTDSLLRRDVTEICKLIRSRAQKRSRTIVGVAGPPASGKSTLAELVVRRFLRETGTEAEAEAEAPGAVLLPMDGYHLDNRILEARGLLARKGAPETFNAHGFCEDVARLPGSTRELFFPRFDRRMDVAIANAISVLPATPIIVVEGNYLLLASAPWSALRNIFDATVFVCPTLDQLRDRLRRRWIEHGDDDETALQRAEGNDLPNAELVLKNSTEADLRLNQNYTEFGVRYAY